jgi:hypothetical protein
MINFITIINIDTTWPLPTNSNVPKHTQNSYGVWFTYNKYISSNTLFWLLLWQSYEIWFFLWKIINIEPLTNTINTILWCIWEYLGVFGCNLGTFGCIWVYLGIFGCIWVYLGIFGCIWVKGHARKKTPKRESNAKLSNLSRMWIGDQCDHWNELSQCAQQELPTCHRSLTNCHISQRPVLLPLVFDRFYHLFRSK